MVSKLPPDALVACDVTAGADSTMNSVPLMISREMPGHKQRVSKDITFEHALSEVGFESYWISNQSREMAWPDAKYKFYDLNFNDFNFLPRLSSALSSNFNRKVIVLHAYNAHRPYCSRYQLETAPYKISCEEFMSVSFRLDELSIDRYKLTYANAVDASVKFIDQILKLSSTASGEVFVLFSSDHGENLRDDYRKLEAHALSFPTRWDIQVPIIFWANDRWKNGHRSQWLNLKKQIDKPLMHADIIPTMMAAVNVQYDEQRKGVAIDLLNESVPQRDRIIQTSLGNTTSWSVLLNEAK